MMKHFALTALMMLTALHQGAADTNAIAPRSVGSISFKNTPIQLVGSYFATLTGKPVIMSQNVMGVFDFERGDMTVEEAVKDLTAELRARGGFLVDVDDRYFKLVPSSQTNQTTDVPHIEVEILPQSISVDDVPVRLEEFAQVNTNRATPNVEVWIHDASSRYAMMQEGQPGKTNFSTVASLLATAGVRRDKIFRAFLPK